MIYDSHTHSVFSFDGSPEATPAAMCETAVRKGLSGIAITDHFDVNGDVEGIYPAFDAGGAFHAVSEAKEAYRGRLRVAVGVELGQATEYPNEARAFLDRNKYDFVLGSIHNLPGVPDFYYLLFREIPDALSDQLFARTLDETIKLCDFEGIHAIAHLTYMHRYIVKAGRTLDFAKHKEHIEALFRKMIRKGLSLEINVSLLRSGRELFMPTKELIALYRENGGELFTVGSDAHDPKDIGANISDGYDLLRALGVPSVAFYENGTPDLIRL